MKAGIHPKYENVTITCMGCGTKIQTRSTRCADFSIDVCSHCHPFYTGRQKYVDSAGRIERFQKKWKRGGAAKPSEEKPSEEKPAEEKPAEEKLAEEKQEA